MTALSLPLPSRAARLRLLVLAIADRCDQRCVHCQIWMGPAADAGKRLTREERLAVVDEAIHAGVEEVLLTGGEPLLSPELLPIAERLKRAGVRTLLATNGLLIAAHAEALARLFDEVYVSLDGAAATHDQIRGVPSFERVAQGVLALRSRSPRPRLIARCTLHGANLGELPSLVETTRLLGFDHVSFLPLDATSEAFGGRSPERARLLPSRPQLAAFDEAIARLHASDGFVLEDQEKLRRLGRHLLAGRGEAAFERPACDAPWWSSVVEADGRLRPCFFHETAGDVRQGLLATRDSKAYAESLARIRGPNSTCERCVCPKRRGIPLRERLFA